MTDNATAARMRRQQRMMRIVNVPMRRVLALPFRTPLSKQLMLVNVIGRKSGRVYRQPVSYVTHGDVLLTPGGGRWTRNLEGGRPVRVRLQGQDRQAVPELVRDRAEVERLLRILLAANPGAASFMPFTGPDGQLDPAKLDTALRYGFCVVRWRLDQPASG